MYVAWTAEVNSCKKTHTKKKIEENKIEKLFVDV